MAADYETFYVVSVAVECIAQVVFEACAVESTAHTDHAVTRQAESVQRQISHRVHRVRNHYEDSVRAVFQYLVANALYDTCVHADQLLTRHTRLTRQTRSDDHYVATCGLAVVVGHTLYYGVEAHQLRRLHDIHGFTLGKTLLDINQTYFVGYLVNGQHICARSTYVTCAYYCYFAHCFKYFKYFIFT